MTHNPTPLHNILIQTLYDMHKSLLFNIQLYKYLQNTLNI